jgi:hypothetical protein
MWAVFLFSDDRDMSCRKSKLEFWIITNEKWPCGSVKNVHDDPFSRIESGSLTVFGEYLLGTFFLSPNSIP